MKTGIFKLAFILLVTLAINACATTLYVDANGTNPVPPYTDWSTAATNIQDAVNIAAGGTVLVTNGIYQYGGMNNSRVFASGPMTIQSVNGPAVTIIRGAWDTTTNGPNALRCAYLPAGSVLSGFTLANGATTISGVNSGGGVFCASSTAIVTNCVIIGNSAYSSGGGAYSGTLINCSLIGNLASTTAGGGGGGANNSTLINCLLARNFSGYSSGGAGLSTLINCTVVSNVAAAYAGAGWNSTFKNSIVYYNNSYYNNADDSGGYGTWTNCCMPFAVNFGVNNLTNPPQFASLADGDYHLSLASPCINAGNNSFVTVSNDLDGNLRIVGGEVDMGCYESQNRSLIHYVSLSSINPETPYTNWSTAATNIQDAVDAAFAGEIVLVTNGVYTTGGRVVYGAETNRVVLKNALTLLSVNGPTNTLIVGGIQTRCIYLGSNSVISGFTITNGQTRLTGDMTNEQSGGGIWCEPGGAVVNCLVVSNFAGNRNNFQSGRLGGGVYGGTISNCLLTGNFAGSGGGAGGAGALWDCTLSNNVANSGGGAFRVALYNCTLSNNTAVYNGNSGTGAGAAQCLAYNCVLTGNRTDGSGYGGGSYYGTNFNCSITGNWGNYGGGTYQSTNYNCVISGNAASIYGGGAYQGSLYNCVLSGNIATNSYAGYGSGAGAYGALLVNCTVTGNAASGAGGGIYGGFAFNSIIYFNTAAIGGANWTNNPQFYYCCTTPALVVGPLMITNDPSFVDAAGGDYQLKCGSPCIDAGYTNWFSPIGPISAPTNDIRGMARPLDGGGGIAKFDMGAYEFNPATDNVPRIRPMFSYSTFSTGFTMSWVAQIGGCADYFWWDFGDGTTITNQYNVSHAWSAPGTFTIRLSASYSGTVLSAMTTVQVVPQPVYYVNAANGSPVAPYTNWVTAATSIQPAIAAGNTVGRLVLVTNGLYQSLGVTVNGAMLNSVALTNAVFVQGVNGPAVTAIKTTYVAGERCAYVGNNSVLSGFTLTGGGTLSTGDTNNDQSGGGVWCEPGGVVSNCVVAGCRANYFGGGVFQGTFYDCLFTNNGVYTSGSTARGGAVYQAVLYNCNLISNRVSSSFPGGKGGGSFGGMLFNCTLTGNLVNNGDLTGTGGGAYLGTLYNCVLTGNTGLGYGGGACSNNLWNCTLSGNWADYGGGAYASTLHNCLVTSNQALFAGGGLYSGTLYNCTVANNTAANGGGFYANNLSIAYNSIVYGNTASASGNNWQGNLIGSNNCAVPQLPIAAWGNITNDPVFVDAAGHLSAASPCRGAGNSLFATGMDLDGEAWNNPPSMGADEVYDADFVGGLSVAIQSGETTLLINRSLALTGLIAGRASGLEWLFGDGIIATNISFFTSHSWASPGDYTVVFTAYNTDNPGGVSTNLLVHVLPLDAPVLQPTSFSVSSTNGFQFQFAGQSNAIYTVQMTTNLMAPVVWQTLQTIASTGGLVQVTDANATNVTSFYRVGVQ